MKTHSQLSIIIVTWNTADITLKCVQSIKKYLKNLNYEIIIVNNASTDDTVTKLKKEGGVVIVENESNLGFGGGNNAGAAVAKGEYLLFLNSDMELIDNKLIEMYEYLTSHPDVGIIGPKFLNIDLTPQGSVWPPQTISNAFKEFWLGHNTYSKYVPASKEPIEVFSVSGGAIMMKDSLFKKVGGWDKRYFMYFEDLELCRQIRKLGYKIYYYPDCKVIHRHGTSGKDLTDISNQWRRLIPSSKIYHGHFKHLLLFLVTWSGQKWQKLFFKK
ncbi:MAG TPA: glycosyltransferase family 2 protein [Candidatus Woesebacteria bacterium]|nr:glycosyltransferase family 2 protein [Candidatus Woesebacteria bacterium]